MLLMFEDCILDAQRYELRRAGTLLPLRTKVFQVLTYLVTHHDRVVSRDELKEQVWPSQFIADTTLSACIKAARRAVGDAGRLQRVIKTIHGQGYRCIATVSTADDSPYDVLLPYFFLEKGRILRATEADAGAVEAVLQRAVLDARSHHNRWFELQAVVELVELLQTVGRASDARDMLDDLFNRLHQFSELQRTPVFRRAEILYATLSQSPE